MANYDKSDAGIGKKAKNGNIVGQIFVATFIVIGILLLAIGSVLMGSVQVDAADGGSTMTCDDSSSAFLGFPTWYRGLTCDGDGHIQLNGGQSIFESVIIVGLNVVDIVLRLVGLVAIAFIIYGGFQYLIARGEPSNIVKAKTTITRAVIGLVVGIASSAIVGFLVGRL